MDFKKQREKKDLTMEEVAIKAGLSVQGYRLIEIGATKRPRKETIEAIKKVLYENKSPKNSI